jgi:hypothetical protein
MDFIFGFIGWALKVIQPAWEAAQPFFVWHSTSTIGNTISGTVWMFPVIETVHILAMAVMFGGMLVLNLRLLGLGMTRQPLPMLAGTLMPFVNWGVAIMLVSGYMMFSSEAMKSYANDGFKFKMMSLATVLIFQYTLYRAIVKKDDAERNKALGAACALFNFLLWFCVGVGGRAIGFV